MVKPPSGLTVIGFGGLPTRFSPDFSSRTKPSSRSSSTRSDVACFGKAGGLRNADARHGPVDADGLEHNPEIDELGLHRIGGTQHPENSTRINMSD